MFSVLIPNHLENNIEEFVKEIEKAFPCEQIIIATDRYGKGKGWALREALKEAKGDIIIFLDADGDISPKMIKRFLPFLEDCDAVIGSKTVVNSPLHRKIITYLSRVYIRLMFALPFDTQTGLKMFRRNILPSWKTDGYAFDIEILNKLKKNKARIIEIPIEASIKGKVSLKMLWRIFLETLKIRIFQ